MTVEPPAHDPTCHVYAVSDGSGETAEHVAKAAALQFRGHPIRLIRLPRVRTQAQVAEMVELASQTRGLIVYTVMDASIRRLIHEQTREAGLDAVDILGPVVMGLQHQTGATPTSESGLLQLRDEKYFNRMEAIDFAIKYDDGKDPKGLVLADVILVGVSRTSKTPTCMYLAQNRGLKTSNVPLVLNVTPPRELFEIASTKVVGLTVDAAVLQDIRSARLQSLGLSPKASYASLTRIQEEVLFAQTIFDRIGCPVVDVTNKAIEETASEIMDLTQRKDTLV